MRKESGKYRWLVLGVVFLSQALSYGMTFSVGVLYKDWIGYFDSSSSFLSLVGSAPTAIAGLMGPLFGILRTKFSLRQCSFVGGFLMAIGMTASSLVVNSFELLITFGFVAGFGLGLHAFIACTMINEYFFENRVFAEGVMGAGIGFGTFVFSLFQQYLLNNFSWRGAMMISGGIILHLCLNSMFFVSSLSISTHPFNLWKNNEVQKRFSLQENRCSCDDIAIVLKVKNKEKSESFFKRSLYLWKNYLFLMLIASDFFGWLAIFIPYVHLVKRATLNGMDENEASWLSSTFGLTSIIGRPFTGYISNYFRIYPLWSYCANQATLGLLTLLSSFWSSNVGLFTFAIFFGFLSNGYGFMKASIAKLIGVDQFSDAYSWMILVEGVGILVGPLLAGYIFDVTQSYNWSFRFSGMLLILSAAICLFKSVAKQSQNKSEAKTLTVASEHKRNSILCEEESYFANKPRESR